MRLDESLQPIDNIEKLYTEASISFQASLSKVGAGGTESIYSTDEFSFIPVKRGRLLDIGCSTGYFLSRARGRGWETFGIDIDPLAINYAREQLGLNVRFEQLKDSSYPTHNFDVITLWGVLEHLPDPYHYLKIIGSLLKPNGLLVVAVPNLCSLNAYVSRLSTHEWDMFCEPGHLYHFNIQTLTKLLKRISFQLISWGTATILIRGKLPFWPQRIIYVEKTIQKLYHRSSLFRFTYRLALKSLDCLKLGDILVASFVNMLDLGG
jgi:2-polyprenyl-3-methyl-5-hydroxy-6-metoxy-1,4-benzoquinol methylase